MTRFIQRPLGGMVSALAFLALGLFVFIAKGMAAGDWTDLDHALIRASRGVATPILDVMMEILTRAGEVAALSAVVLISAGWAWWLRAVRGALAVLAAGLLTALLTTQLQALFARERPRFPTKVARIQNYGFPSGHAVAGVAVYGTLALVVARRKPRWRGGLAVAAPVLAFLIGFSRIYLGFHWPSDVVAGWALGAAVFFVSWAILGPPP
jgi:undecaprenyl-diphosphatase